MMEYSDYPQNKERTPFLVQSPAHRSANSLGQPLQHLWVNSERIASRLPNLLKEINIDFGTSDKIFSSEWLSETEILIGSKCNKVNLLAGIWTS